MTIKFGKTPGLKAPGICTATPPWPQQMDYPRGLLKLTYDFTVPALWLPSPEGAWHHEAGSMILYPDSPEENNTGWTSEFKEHTVDGRYGIYDNQSSQDAQCGQNFIPMWGIEFTETVTPFEPSSFWSYKTVLHGDQEDLYGSTSCKITVRFL